MAQLTTYLTGTAKWTKRLSGEGDTKYKCWTFDFYPDADSMAKFEKLETELMIREDKETKEKFIKLRRQFAKMIKDKLQKFDPPELFDANNDPWDEAVAIGNGSKVTVKIVVFDSIKGKGVRLESVRIDELVPFENTNEVDTTGVDSPF